MGTYVETKIVALTSQSANIKFNSTFLSNLRFNLGSIYNNHDDIVNKQVQLLNAQIPYSFYIINSTNNIFRYQMIPAGTLYTVPISPGNYNGNSLITALKAAFSLYGFTMDITLSPIDGKILFSYTGGTVWTLYPSTNSILPILGFPNTANITSNFTGTAYVINGVYPLNLLGIKTLQIRSSNLLMTNISSVQGGQTTLLSTISVDCVPFGMMNYVDKGNHFMSLYNDSLDDLDIDIVSGEDGNYIDFNNQDWCITLAFHLTKSIAPIQRPKISKLLNTAILGQSDATVSSPLVENTNNLEKQQISEPQLNPESQDLRELNLLTE
jgi:hypothetical protein